MVETIRHDMTHIFCYLMLERFILMVCVPLATTNHQLFSFWRFIISNRNSILMMMLMMVIMMMKILLI